MLSRKDLLRSALVGVVATALPGLASAEEPPKEITVDDLKAMEKVAGFELTDAERKEIRKDVQGYLKGYEAVRKEPIEARTSPALLFRTLAGGSTDRRTDVRVSDKAKGDAGVAYLPVRKLAAMLRAKEISSRELTELSLSRLKKYGPKLECVITLTESRAMASAKKADEEIAAGRFRSPLHGVPYGLKDLFSVAGYRTTWGADPYMHQTFDYDAAVVERLDMAGAVLVAKTTTGALAMDNVWFGGATKNPWNLSQGSSGSSAGSAASVAAGLVPFAIGTETLGSIVSPSVRCRATGLRPTFGRVSRYGAMELSFSMDKAGPIVRSVEDAALVLAAIHGADPRDACSVDRPFRYRSIPNLKGMRIGYAKGKRDGFVDLLAKLGAEVREVVFTDVPDGVVNVLEVEAASAFDALTRDPAKIALLKDSLWPNIFRTARHMPGVEYLQAMRARHLLIDRFEREFGDLHAYVSPDISDTVVHTNLTGHPQIALPQGDDGKGNSVAQSITGRLFEEGRLLAIARLAQEAGDFHLRTPPGFA
ncbi:amidase [soil metagenome]